MGNRIVTFGELMLRFSKEDKKRLENWMNDWWERKELYQSMVAYQ